MQLNQTSDAVELGARYIFLLSVLATVGLAFMWWAFWRAVSQRGESVREILLSQGFFRTVVVMGVIAAAVVLSLAGRLESNITGAILSGIVGYVLGQVSAVRHQRAAGATDASQKV